MEELEDVYQITIENKSGIKYGIKISERILKAAKKPRSICGYEVYNGIQEIKKLIKEQGK